MSFRPSAYLRTGMIILIAGLLPFFGGCDKRAFKKAEQKNTIEAYNNFLAHYPKSSLANGAQGHLIQLSYAEAVRQDTAQAYVGFLKRYPNSAPAGAARESLKRLVNIEVSRLSAEQMNNCRAQVRTDLGTIKIRLSADKAPETCRNFIKLAKTLFYDGTEFSFLVPGVLVQGGSPQGDPRGGPGYTIKAEFNDLPNIPGAVGMVRWEHPDSAGSQFYIALRRLPDRDGKFTVFGQVEAGLEVVEAISDLETNGPQGKPYTFQPVVPVFIRSVEIISADK
jgi:peptidyl-prolyl cis-trans isomerase B (cyclophilin B)